MAIHWSLVTVMCDRALGWGRLPDRGRGRIQNAAQSISFVIILMAHSRYLNENIYYLDYM
jgi:hypothetical protein